MDNTTFTIRISIVDDHPMVLYGLQATLQKYSHIHVQALYKNGSELMDGLALSLPDVLLMDIQLPDIQGDELASQLLKKYPALKILVLTNFDSPLYVSKMQWLGVHGYLLKTADEDVLIRAIEKVAAGEHFLEKEMQDNIALHPIRSKKMLAAKTTLTKREKEILCLIADGMTDQKISETLFLGVNTIKHYRKTLLLKLEVSNTAMLVRKALQLGFIN